MTQRRLELGVTGCAAIPPAWEKVIAACLSKNPDERPISGAVILAMLALPERRGSPSPTMEVAKNLRLEAEPLSQPVGRVSATPEPALHPRVASLSAVVRPSGRASNLRPLRTVSTAVFEGIGAVIGAVVRPVIKVALVVALVWGLLVIKGRWDTEKAEREAIAARQAETAKETAATVPDPATPAAAQPVAPRRSTALDRPPAPGPGHPGNRPPPRRAF